MSARSAAKKRAVPERARSRKSAGTPAVIQECRVVAVLANGAAQVELEDGRSCEARLPQHVSVAWLREALKVEPVEAAVALLSPRRALLWCVFPGPAHQAVVVDLELVGRTVRIRAEEGVTLQCNEARLELSEGGDVTLRGRDVLSRAAGLHRIKGGSIRLN